MVLAYHLIFTAYGLRVGTRRQFTNMQPYWPPDVVTIDPQIRE